MPNQQEIKKILFSKDNNFRDENEIIFHEKNRIKIEKLCAFKKIISVEFTHLEFTNKIIKKPQPILISDTRNIIEELENNEKQHNLKFNVVKTDISDTIKETTKINAERDYKTIFVFLFMWDYSNFDSFEKVKFYYEEIDKVFKLSQDSSNPSYEMTTIFVGNKIDAKQNLSEDCIKSYESFFEKVNFPIYNISTASYFNFERFFESFFNECLSLKLEENCREETFKKKLKNILFLNKTFAKAEKHKLELKDVPGPKYDLDVYSVTADDKFYKAFNPKERFQYKTFMNKTGPILSVSKDHNQKLNNKKSKQKSSKINTKTDMHQTENLEIYKKSANDKEKHKTATSINSKWKQGYTLGIKPAVRTYRKERQNKLKEVNDELNELFKTNVIFYKTGKKRLNKANSNKDLKSSIGIETARDTFRKTDRNNSVYGIKAPDRKKRDYGDLYKGVVSRREEKELEKLRNLEDLREKQEQQYEEYLERMNEINDHRKRVSASRSRIKKVVVYPKLVNITQGFVNEKNKFTMGAKTKLDFTYNKHDPSFRKVETDIEYKLKHPNLSFPKAERFKKTGLELKERLKDDYMKQADYYYREEEKLMDFKDKRLMKQDHFLNARREHREQIFAEREKNRLELYDPLKNMTHETPGPGAYSPYYDYVEEASPSYTLKGKLKTELFEVTNNYNDPTKLLDYDSNLNVLPNLPDFNVVKDSFPRVLFSKYPRFKDNLLNTHTHFKGNNFEFEPDKTGFHTVDLNNDKNRTFYMGKSKRFGDNIDKDVPGPNMYRIAGFADEIMRKTQNKFNAT
eukprot:CAMPEP_0170537322 /NCGR_PEP_ID=MMETSP0209-20121228/102644_1 /TAXON_ID=665100 ORGANISM="Litonotus pictus, Strain P1" /NCGR_SAMPLE_ID=MMETSP0209 /ASSEMBLY_ACC=CAM_ASM_000301 /LENGTH=798 /DNA_ID=CAMNT_0010838797 /DNA_START=45 /DNA_END=2438 /DNA_ORIENTATION=-